MGEMYLKARKFAEENIVPYAEEIDKKGVFPKEIFDKIGEAGYFGLIIPKELGGWGLSLSAQADVTRAFAEACTTVGLSYMMHNVAVNCIIESNDEMKQEVCKDIIENKAMAGLGFSETGTGVHQIPEVAAEFTEDSVILNGKKAFVTCAGYASYILINVNAQSGQDVDNWLLPVKSEGVSFQPEEWHGLGVQGNASCPMDLKHVKLANRYRTNEAGKGLAQAVGTCMPFFLTGLAAVSAGLNSAILAEAIRHSKERKYTGGQALCEIPSIQIDLAHIYNSTNATQALLYEAVRSYENGEEDAFTKILSVRSYSSDEVINNAKLGMRIGGGIAYNKQTCMERLMRDSLAGHVMSPSTNVLYLWMGRLITGQPMA